MVLMLMPFLFWLLPNANGNVSQYAKPSETLILKWNKAYPDDTIDQSALGLAWAFSYCGAMLPDAPHAIEVGTDQIVIHPDELGFNEKALARIKKLHQNIKNSPEYRRNQNIDLGRYVTLLIGAPEHYYQITGVPEKLSDLLSAYNLKAEKGYINHSSVSRIHRKIEFSEPNGLNQLFVSSETDSVTGQIYEYETIDIMPNAQLRFGIYDANGQRKNSTSAAHTEAGKPAKCMWCHESKVSPMFNKQLDNQGFLTYLQLQDKLVAYNQLLSDQQLALPGGVNFAQKQQHTQTELLYISFMEPSAERLSLEWNMPVTQVRALLAAEPTHVYDEFPFLGNLYHRAAIERFAPFKGLAVSTQVREASLTEVNHLN